jgi:two-component system, NarL family, nitrate/nitrite response regulator NarL
MRILVVDDHSLFRDGIISLLEADGHQVVGQAGDGLAAVEAIGRLNPDLTLMDINMPVMNGIDALRQIKAYNPEAKVIMLTVSEDETNLVNAIRAGADGYLLKHLNARDFLEMVNSLERGEAAITRSMTMRLLKHITTMNVEEEQTLLSERELEILQMVAAGKSNRAIAEQLSISENTVKYHLKNILQKLGVSNRTEAVTLAMQKGLL